MVKTDNVATSDFLTQKKLTPKQGRWQARQTCQVLGNPLFFIPKPFFFRYAAPLVRGTPCSRSENKAGGILRWGKSFDCVLNIDPCLSCSTS